MVVSRFLADTASRLRHDTRGAGAAEFAVILPLMLTLLFGLIEITNGVAADRKVTLTARALSDLVSQAVSVADSDISESFSASKGVMSPFDTSTLKAKITELKIDGSGQAKVAWSKANANDVARATDQIVTIPSALAVPNTYLIWSEISYQYKPIVSWLISSSGIPLTEQFFTRPRQSNCVLYSPSTSCP